MHLHHESQAEQHLTASVTRRGQVTLPAEVRRHLGVKARGRVAFTINPQGTVQITVPQYPNIASLRGAAGKLDSPLSWQQMRQIGREDRLEGKHAPHV